jgi:hypothetical protein
MRSATRSLRGLQGPRPRACDWHALEMPTHACGPGCGTRESPQAPCKEGTCEHQSEGWPHLFCPRAPRIVKRGLLRGLGCRRCTLGLLGARVCAITLIHSRARVLFSAVPRPRLPVLTPSLLFVQTTTEFLNLATEKRDQRAASKGRLLHTTRARKGAQTAGAPGKPTPEQPW